MKIKMTNKRFPNGSATPESRDVATWEAAGWVAVPEPNDETQSSKKGKSK